MRRRRRCTPGRTRRMPGCTRAACRDRLRPGPWDRRRASPLRRSWWPPRAGGELLCPRGFAGPRPLPGQAPSMARIGLAPPRPALLRATSRPGAELLPHAWLTTSPPGLHRPRGGQGRFTVFTGIGGNSWVRAATAASETAAEAVLEHVLRSILDTTGLERS